MIWNIAFAGMREKGLTENSIRGKILEKGRTAKKLSFRIKRQSEKQADV